MAKKGMHRVDDIHSEHKSKAELVPELQGRAKLSNEKANPIIAGTQPPSQKVYHSKPHSERPISNFYSYIDNDLARDNLENDIPSADLQDL
jgi:hypothetical protein